MGYLRRQLITAALTANALRPARGVRSGIPSFAAGWLTTELAPHLLSVTAADTAINTARGRGSRLGYLLAGASALGLSALIRESGRSRALVSSALDTDLGADYVTALDAAPTPAELATPWRSLVNPFRMRQPGVRVIRGISYGPAGRRNELDLYLPAESNRTDAPVLLQIHGGAWTIGNKEQQGVPLMQHLAAKGWVCVAINYRLAPRDRFPAQIIDVKQAIAWIRENISEYGGDPNYLALTGGSAGGHLTALAALTPNDPAYQPGFEEAETGVQVAVPHYGVYDMAGATGLRSAIAMRDGFLGKRVFAKSWAQDPEAYEAASPILRITPDAPDFFVIHGTNDTLVSVEQARLFVERLREVSKRTVVFAELPGTQHAFDIFPSIRSAHVVRAIDRYLHWHWNTWRRQR
ncbi:alpha/beta hydrolase fold domain-containing protein [Nocardioides sp. Bht2]|uniref:alpha/beta hydrolase fold domain-containing protein n=1 Tax=Nocardioides sp. Bht2 TaxID=3392297 RepID=UPI0039B6A2CE